MQAESIETIQIYRDGCLALAEKCASRLINPEETIQVYSLRPDERIMDKALIEKKMSDAYKAAKELDQVLELRKTGEDHE